MTADMTPYCNEMQIQSIVSMLRNNCRELDIARIRSLYKNHLKQGNSVLPSLIAAISASASFRRC